LLIEYRLAPEHVFPAALEDALTAYRWLLANGTKPEHIVIGGDSAGGGLAMALLTTLRDKGDPLPAGAVLLSPWTDVAGTGESMTTHAEIDPWLSSAAFNFVAPLYAGAEDIRNPLISPVFADLHGLPPLYIHVGTDEILLNDSTRLAERAKAVGVTAHLQVWEGMWHVFQAFAYTLPEGQQAIDQIGEFIRSSSHLKHS
jgi:acetyl esterase/lipase